MLTQRDEQIEKALSGRDVPTLLRIFFDGFAGVRKIRDGVCHESELWDYKEILPDPGRGIENDKAWSDLAATVLGFYNNHGGILFFGVTNNFAVPGIRTRLDSKILNEKLRRYISDRIWVEFQRVFIASDQTCVGIALCPRAWIDSSASLVRVLEFATSFRRNKVQYAMAILRSYFQKPMSRPGHDNWRCRRLITLMNLTNRTIACSDRNSLDSYIARYRAKNFRKF